MVLSGLYRVPLIDTVGSTVDVVKEQITFDMLITFAFTFMKFIFSIIKVVTFWICANYYFNQSHFPAPNSVKGDNIPRKFSSSRS